MASLAKIKQDVRIILYRNEGYDPMTDIEGMENIDNLKVDELIETLIPLAVDKVYAVAPLPMLGDVIVNGGSSEDNEGDNGIQGGIEWDNETDEYASVAKIPSSVVRVVSVKLPNWKRAVYDMTSFTDALYDEYRSEFPGVRPTSSFPAVAIGSDWESGQMRVEAYPKMDAESATKANIGYVSKFNPDEDIQGDEVHMSGRVYNAIIYTICQLYYTSLGEKARADMMENEALILLNLQEDKR